MDDKKDYNTTGWWSCNDEYDKGFNKGNKTGYDIGFVYGKEEGKELGYATGRTDGFNEGEKHGREIGYYEGKEDGIEIGYKNGYKEGYDDGYKLPSNKYKVNETLLILNVIVFIFFITFFIYQGIKLYKKKSNKYDFLINDNPPDYNSINN